MPARSVVAVSSSSAVTVLDVSNFSGGVVNSGMVRGRRHHDAQDGGVVRDPNGGTLAYAETLSNGAPLPSWLNFDPATASFSGPMPDGTKALAINVSATDGHSLTASETFVLSITQVASQFGQAIAGMTSGTTSSTGSLTFTPSPQDHSTNLASPAHS